VFGAEDTPPPAADRLWEQVHPAELTFLIASGTSLAAAGPDEGRQNFQIVSADIRAVWRIGLTDADALHAHYAVVDPAAILRGTAARVVAAWFAGETLDAVLGEAREDQATGLRAAIQRDLDEAGAGIELIGLVIEAIHPPAGAADAYHAVQAAEIIAHTQIAAERGNAQASLAKASRFATDIVGNAKARAGETVAEARAWATRFSADIVSGHVGGPSFLLNRYLSNVGAALSTAPLTIVDHRIPAADTPMLDLRPPTLPSASAPGAE
jgi:regulator of protease activity HflC (stomatin/prohibitin superfamily)